MFIDKLNNKSSITNCLQNIQDIPLDEQKPISLDDFKYLYIKKTCYKIENQKVITIIESEEHPTSLM